MPRTANTAVLKDTLARLLESETPLTKSELGISDYFIAKLLGANHVKIADTVKNLDAEGKAQRGHPANRYGLTPNGRKAAKRFVARNAAQEASAA